MKSEVLKNTLLALVLVTGLSTVLVAQVKTSDITGAWETGINDIKTTRIYTDQFFAVSVYNVRDKQFISTAGGRWKFDGKDMIETFEFHTAKPELIGQQVAKAIELKNGKLVLTADDRKKEAYIRLDNGTPGKLGGAWLITGRVNDGKASSVTPGARRTMKILSGTRFQWIAYNVDTKEFSGTGGGTYTTEDGKYTEHILFFSRDSKRVGADLQFDFSLEDGKWRHKGLSSKGDPIDETWTKRDIVGL
jgi:hypothetical protein